MPHVLITGASSGIGEAIARYGATKGWKMTLVARREANLRAIAESMPEVETFVRPADLSDLSVCQPLLEEATEALGPIDVLINNAGIQYVEPTVGVTPERSDLLFTVDLLAPMRLLHGVLPQMLERGSGSIINISSVAGLIFTPGMCHYNAAKAGLAAASESLAAEIKDSGVHVLTVYPGPVESPMESAARDAFTNASSVDALPTGTGEELAALIDKAITKKQTRLIYPKFYAMGRYTRVFSQWITNVMTPDLKAGDS